MNNDLSYQLALRISEILDEKQLSQTDLANRLGKDPSVVSRWLRGSHNFNLTTIQELSDALGEPLITVQPSRRLAAATATETPAPPRRKYKRRCPVSVNKQAECFVPDFTPEHRQRLAELPQVQQFKEVNRLRQLDQQDPDKWALWTYLYKHHLRNLGKHGSSVRATPQGMKRKVIPLRFFVENEFRKGHSLLYHFPQLVSLSPAEVLATLP